LQAWTVSLLVHLVILSALAAATFSAKAAADKVFNIDSALTGFRVGEPELLPIYADAANILRDKAVGDAHASMVGESAIIVANEGEGDGGGGSISKDAAGTRRSSKTPSLHGVGNGRINEGTSLPGAKVDGLGGPLCTYSRVPQLEVSAAAVR
jgi:hypothetical protein